MPQTPRHFGAVEAGGTKFVCAVGDAEGHILVEERFPTTDPVATLARTQDFLEREQARLGPLAAIGVGSFGPVELRPDSARYGHIGRTPKPGWADVDIVGPLSRRFRCPVGFDTDVNAAALSEHRWGAARDVANVVYVTVGTGIGGGILIDGKPVHGLMHPEIGHMFPRRPALDPTFAGTCPFHRDCLEGLASGPAIQARSGAALDALTLEHPQWAIQGDYLAQLCATLVMNLSPQRIVLGGGVMSQLALFPIVRTRLREWLGGYIEALDTAQVFDAYVVPPGLGAQAGVLGALALAIDARESHAA